MKKLQHQQVTFLYNRNGAGIIVRNKNKVFRPLLSHGPQSVLVENGDIYIPMNPRPAKTKLYNTSERSKKTSQSVHHDKKPAENPIDTALSRIDTVEPQSIRKTVKYRKPFIPKSRKTLHCTSYNYLADPRQGLKPSPYSLVSTVPGTNRPENLPIKPKPSPSINPFEVYESKRTLSKTRAEPRRTTIPKEKVVYKPKPQADSRLTEDEQKVYGNRFPSGYQKVSLLGRGGCAVVWLGKNVETNKRAAIKQFAKTGANKSDLESCKIEILVGSMLFPASKTEDCPGLNSIAQYVNYINDNKDIWIIHEVGGTSLSKNLFDVKGEFFKGERIYRVHHMPFYEKLKTDPALLKELLRKVLSALDLLQDKGIIHADLKPDNVLLEYDGDQINSVKLIDFGSAFFYNKPCNMRMSTPEYLAPECLDYLDGSLKPFAERQDLCKRIKAWSIDIFSVGAILLEILTGFPLWLSLKGRVETEQSSMISYGLFAVQGKVPGKILQKQKEVIGNVKGVLERYHCFIKNREVVDLLEKMLKIDPMTRISPRDALNHPFLIK